jgi:anti-sigma B factor antagonist
MTNGELDVRTRREGDEAVVAVTGAIDIASAHVLDEAIMRVLADAPRTLTVDLRRTNHFDSSGVRVLVRAMRHSRTAGIALSVCLAPDSGVHKVLELSGFSGAVRIVSDC